MIWLTWRQFRIQAWGTLICLTVVAAAYAVTGPGLAHLYGRSGLGSCVAAGNCATAQATFALGVTSSKLYGLLYFGGIGVVYVAPVVIGIFWGAPLIARELEAGSLRLAWTQSVTRLAWITAKLGLLGVAAMLATGALSLVVTRWSQPIDQANGLPDQDSGLGLPHHFTPLVFGARGIAPMGYAAFAFALGVVVGLLVRRTLTAMVITLVVLAAVLVAVPSVVRAHYATAERTTTPMTFAPGSPQSILINGDTLQVSTPVASLPGDWILSVRTVDSAGNPFTGPAPRICLDLTSSVEDCDSALNQLHLQQLVTYQPADRYWLFQWWETAIYVLAALALVALCLARVRRLYVS
jgi:hypothetical protein